MKTWLTRSRMAVPALLVVALSSCGGDGDESEEVPDLITINSPSENPTLSPLVALSGTRSSSVHAVNWSNAAGGGGAATLTAQECVVFPIGRFPCNHGWSASIPLVVGNNLITVIGHGGIDSFTRVTITITRTP
jgi:hypothetical protein